MEKLIREHALRAQGIYDAMPPLIQNVLTSARGLFLARNRYSPEGQRFLRELRGHESWRAQQLSDYSLRALQQAIERGRRTVPFYASYPRFELRRMEDLELLPVVTRDDVGRNAERFVCRSLSRLQRIWVRTTGTTGASLKIAYTARSAQRDWAFRMRQWAWAGVEPRTPRITLFSSRIAPVRRTRPPFWTYNLPERQILVSIFHFSPDAAPSYLRFLKRHAGKVLEGFPSVLGIVADFVLQSGEPIPMRVVFTDGEPLYPFLREKIEKAFQARIYDSYGNTELCGLIQECEQGNTHLIPEYALLEILDENNQPVPVGQEGYLVWTGFINEAMPLIRYRIGDRGCWQAPRQCACGRAFPVVVPTITRESDLLQSADGRIYSPRALNQILKRAASFRFCQLVQDQPGRVTVRAVPSNGQARAELEMIRSELQSMLGAEMRVDAELASAPIVRAGGKTPLITRPPVP